MSDHSVPSGSPILTAAEMRAAEERVIAGGTSVETLMDRAGKGVAEAAWFFGGGVETQIICGPGNNGGDGYVIAHYLKLRGVDVRVAGLGEPKTPAAIAARAQWGGAVDPLDKATPAELFIDALFGTGLTRGLDAGAVNTLARLAEGARYRVAVDLPSGIATDDGAVLSPVPDYDLTVALGALKPAHLLQPAARHTGRLVTVDIGLGALDRTMVRIARPSLVAPGPGSHKYNRGAVGVIGGAMWGAAVLAASAAQRSGAGSVALSGVAGGGPAALIRKSEAAIFGDERIGALLVGPGLGRDREAAKLLSGALSCDCPVVLDADALTLAGSGIGKHLAKRTAPTILTPHSGEFERMFGTLPGSKIERARAAAAQVGAFIIYKGADTVIAAPDGRIAIAAPGSNWLATAGSGDVLAGIVASMVAQGKPAFEAAQAAVWLHGEAARRAGPVLIADDLVIHLPAAVRTCL